ncbi:MAG: ligase-associated DNA damage response endonuclease PdeM [Granulosicoccus sp.]
MIWNKLPQLIAEHDAIVNEFTAQCLAVTHSGEEFLLHPQRVMYWPAQHILFAADVHVGKEHVFARHGIAIPGGISESTLQRLFTLANNSGARRLIVLGDFMHNVPSKREFWLGELTRLMDSHPDLDVEVVAGNHDRQAGRKLIDSRLTWHASSLNVAKLALHHEPCEDPQAYVLCGHLHPAYQLRSSRRAGVRAPAFWFRKRYAVLPAFGEFTGGVIIKPDAKTDSVYMTDPECVMKVPVVKRSRS